MIAPKLLAYMINILLLRVHIARARYTYVTRGVVGNLNATAAGFPEKTLRGTRDVSLQAGYEGLESSLV